MKKTFSLILILMLALALIAALASCGGEENPGPDDEPDNGGFVDPTKVLDFDLSESGDYYIVTGFGVHMNNTVEIPTEYEGKPVKEIGDYAFDNSALARENLKEIIIPESITKIGKYAFKGCTLLETVTFKGSVTSIGEAAFRSCTALKSVNLPEGLVEIESYAFDMCSNLNGITIPSTVEKIGIDAFRSCPYITGSKATPFHGAYKIPTPGGYWIVRVDRTVTSANLPDNTIGISDGAFDTCKSLTVVEIPAAVKYIGKGAFNGITSLTTVEYGGTAEGWLDIDIGEDNYPLMSAEIIYKE